MNNNEDFQNKGLPIFSEVYTKDSASKIIIYWNLTEQTKAETKTLTYEFYDKYSPKKSFRSTLPLIINSNSKPSFTTKMKDLVLNPVIGETWEQIFKATDTDDGFY